MKKIIISLKMLFITGVLTIGFNACEKETNPTDMTGTGTGMSNTNMTNSSDASVAENIAMIDQNTYDLSMIVDEAYASSTGNTNKTSGQNNKVLVPNCGEIIADMNSEPRSITIDFGTENCLGKDGHNRRGKITATFSGDYRSEGSTLNFTTFDYFVDDNRIDARVNMTNMGRNSKGRIHFSVETHATVTLASVAKTSVTMPGTIAYASNRDQEWVAGEMTTQLYDDVFLVTGTATMTDKNLEFQSQILIPLRKDVGFRHFIWGVERISRVVSEEEANFTVRVDYGYPKGERDNLALVTFPNGTKKVIYLK